MLPLAELSLKDIETILPSDLLRQLAFVYLCGNYGDPVVAKDTIPVLRYMREHNASLRIRVHTNASARDEAWWTELAKIGTSCVFGIDGLKDTNHLYRAGTNWNTIMNNAVAYIKAGGKAEWQFLVFKHNEHQVSLARELSRELGFHRFFVKSTSRFYQPRVGKELPLKVLRRSKDMEYSIAPASDDQYRNPQVVTLATRAPSPAEYDAYLLETEIRCKASERNSFYLSAEGLVLPCCWMSLLYSTEKPREESEVGRLISKLPGGFASINAKLRPVADIIGSDFFQKVIPSLWSKEENRLRVCARNCGSCDVQTGQYTSD